MSFSFKDNISIASALLNGGASILRVIVLENGHNQQNSISKGGCWYIILRSYSIKLILFLKWINSWENRDFYTSYRLIRMRNLYSNLLNFTLKCDLLSHPAHAECLLLSIYRQKEN